MTRSKEEKKQVLESKKQEQRNQAKGLVTKKAPPAKIAAVVSPKKQLGNIFGSNFVSSGTLPSLSFDSPFFPSPINNQSNSNSQNINMKYEVGDIVEVNDPSCAKGVFEGYIGEGRLETGSSVVGVYVWQNVVRGSTGSVDPNSKGYMYSWSVINIGYLKHKSKVAGRNRKKNLEEAFDLKKLDAVVLQPEVKDEILAVLKQHKNHDKIFKEWGLGEVLEYGKGMTFMFYGPPGTGKTWAANCIAKVFGQELLTIGAAEIQTSEPGGANRNIQNAFKTAKEQGKVLFIDECDSLITSRSEVGMILAGEINTLLTEIEKAEGVVILATNRIENMDEALERRISLIVEFPEPNFVAREEIWKRLLPKKMPLGKGVTTDSLAEYKITGGQIKNVVLSAARLAVADESKKVELKHFEAAISRLQKSKSLMGTASRYRQIVVKEDLGKTTV